MLDWINDWYFHLDKALKPASPKCSIILPKLPSPSEEAGTPRAVDASCLSFSQLYLLIITLIFVPSTSTLIWSPVFQHSTQFWSSRLSFVKLGSLSVTPLSTNVIAAIAMEMKKPGPNAPLLHIWMLCIHLSKWGLESSSWYHWFLTLTRWPLILRMVRPWGNHGTCYSVLQDPCWVATYHTPGFGKVSTESCTIENGLRNSLNWGKANLQGQCEQKKRRRCFLSSLQPTERCAGPGVLLDLLCGLHPSGEIPSHLWPLLCCNHEINLRFRKIIRPFFTKHLESGAAVWRNCLGTHGASPCRCWGLWEIIATPVQMQFLPLGDGSRCLNPTGSFSRKQVGWLCLLHHSLIWLVTEFTG